MFVTLVCSLVLLLPCCLSQSINIYITPEEIYEGSTVNITCLASGNSSVLLSLVPFYRINGTYVQHSCIGAAEFQPLTQKFSTLSYIPSTSTSLSARISLSPVSASDNGLSISCAFYNLAAEMVASSEEMILSVQEITPTISMVNTTAVTPFVNSVQFQITVGSVGGVVVLLVIIVLLLVLIIPAVLCVVKRSRQRKQDSPVAVLAVTQNVVYAKADSQAADPVTEKSGDLLKSRTDSIKTENEREFAERYFALPTYSVAVNAGAEEMTASTDISLPYQFSSVDVDTEKKESNIYN